jgi:hypothetical protein
MSLENDTLIPARYDMSDPVRELERKLNSV